MTHTEVEVVQPLSKNDKTRYEFLKREARTGFDRGIDAIREIKVNKLYREQYGTFEAFCQMEFGRTRQHINNLIRADELSKNLETVVSKIEHESWARPLTDLDDPQDQRAALLLAYSAAPAVIASGRPTAALIEESVATIKEMNATKGKVDLGGTMAAATASVITKHNQRVKDAIQDAHIKRGVSNGTVVLIVKHEKCKIVAAANKRPRITIELESWEAFNKLAEMLKNGANGNLEMKLLQYHPKKDSKTGEGA